MRNVRETYGRRDDAQAEDRRLSRGASVGAAFAAALVTLLCCVLPSLLVLLGLGTTVAAVTSALPWLVTLSRHKGWLFLIAGVLIVVARVYGMRAGPSFARDGAACPTILGRWTKGAWWASAILYGLGVFVVYVLGPWLLRGGA